MANHWERGTELGAGLAWAESPEQVGVGSAALERLDGLLQSLVDPEGHALPMATAMVLRRGKVCFHRGYGACAADSIFRIYSMTKPITSLALMMLWEEGKVMLDDPIHLHLGAKWKKRNLTVLDEAGGTPRECPHEIRVWHLLSHTSGLTYGFYGLNPEGPTDAIYQASERKAIKTNESLEELVDRLAGLPLAHDPGAFWNYSLATDVVGRLVEVLSGQSLGEFLQQRIFAPLGMRDTGFHREGVYEEERFTSVHFDHPSGERLDITERQRKYKEYTPAKRMHSGGGGLLSTMQDYALFTQFCLNQGELNGARLVGRKTFELMTRNHLPKGRTCAEMATPSCAYMASPGVGFGLGFAVVVDPAEAMTVMSKGSFFWSGAASTLFQVDPSEDLAFLCFTQLLNRDEMRLPLRTLVSNVTYSAIVDQAKPNANANANAADERGSSRL